MYFDHYIGGVNYLQLHDLVLRGIYISQRIHVDGQCFQLQPIHFLPVGIFGQWYIRMDQPGHVAKPGGQPGVGILSGDCGLRYRAMYLHVPVHGRNNLSKQCDGVLFGWSVDGQRDRVRSQSNHLCMAVLRIRDRVDIGHRRDELEYLNATKWGWILPSPGMVPIRTVPRIGDVSSYGHV